MERTHFFDIPLDWLNRDELIAKLKRFVVSGKPHHITTVNPEFVVVSRTDFDFLGVLEASDLSVVDGTGVVIGHEFAKNTKSTNWFIRWISYLATGLNYVISPSSFPPRITGVALTELLMQLSAEKGWRVFLLGGLPGVAKQASRVWQDRYEGLNVVGTSSADPDVPELIDRIRKTNPDVLIVAYGTPKQEKFLGENKTKLGVPIMVGVGGTFDTVIGRRYNPPRIIKSLGLEWLTFLIRHPQRFRRIWRSTITYSRLVVNTRNH